MACHIKLGYSCLCYVLKINHWLHVFLILFYAGSSTVITSAALYPVNLGISQTWSVWIYTWTTSLVQYLFHWGTYWSCGSCKISPLTITLLGDAGMLPLVRRYMFYYLTFSYDVLRHLPCCVFHLFKLLQFLSCLHHIYFIVCMTLFIIFISLLVWYYLWMSLILHIFYFLCWNRRLNNNSLSGPIPKSLTAITALQVL